MVERSRGQPVHGVGRRSRLSAHLVHLAPRILVQAFAGVGDLNGDGFDDLAGSHQDGAGVFYGSADGPGDVFDWGGLR